MQLHAKTISYLSFVASAFGVLYMSMMIMAIVYATIETKVTATIGQVQTQIATLESSYYDSVAELDAMDPSTLGFVKPAHTLFVSAANSSGLSFAAR